MVWASRWSVAHSIGKFFLCYIILFSSETSAPGSPGNYLYYNKVYIYIYNKRTRFGVLCFFVSLVKRMVSGFLRFMIIPSRRPTAQRLKELLQQQTVPGWRCWEEANGPKILSEKNVSDSNSVQNGNSLSMYQLYLSMKLAS